MSGINIVSKDIILRKKLIRESLQTCAELNSNDISFATDVISIDSDSIMTLFILFVNKNITTSRYALTYNRRVYHAIKERNIGLLQQLVLFNENAKTIFVEAFDNKLLSDVEIDSITKVMQLEYSAIFNALKSLSLNDDIVTEQLIPHSRELRYDPTFNKLYNKCYSDACLRKVEEKGDTPGTALLGGEGFSSSKIMVVDRSPNGLPNIYPFDALNLAKNIVKSGVCVNPVTKALFSEEASKIICDKLSKEIKMCKRYYNM